MDDDTFVGIRDMNESCCRLLLGEFGEGNNVIWNDIYNPISGSCYHLFRETSNALFEDLDKDDI
jgi:hypothetical protein